MAKHWIQTCWATSEMDCYYFSCSQINNCEYHKLLKKCLTNNIKEQKNENKNYHHD